MSRLILAALRAGPVCSATWTATTRNALSVGIYNLRERGYGIETRRLGRKGQDNQLSEYHLIYEPDMARSQCIQTIPPPA